MSSDLEKLNNTEKEKVKETGQATVRRKRLAIIGGGSSGLICLKNALDQLPDWEVVCFEKSDRNIGCWGKPYPGFVSTSTKYTTQFAAFPKFDATVDEDHGKSRSEFFREGEYGEYLEQFMQAFSLQKHIRLKHEVDSLEYNSAEQTWNLTITDNQLDAPTIHEEAFDAVILCSGLTAARKQIECEISCLSVKELNDPKGLDHIQNQTIVVVGGGESAVDYANRLAKSELNNQVYLSLHSGVRVSPRYHPIRGVPSDFLRNRLMLSIHEDMRNWIGQRFVEARIKYQERFEKLFPKAKRDSLSEETDGSEEKVCKQRRKDWTYRLTKAAKDDLFNMFHNKSDDFLTAVGEGRIQIIGVPVDASFQTFYQFDSEETMQVPAELVVPSVGFLARFPNCKSGEIRLKDFYQGCCHVEFPTLFLIGFARPIIGNIPTISEVQAEYVTGILAEENALPQDLVSRHQRENSARSKRYQKINRDAIYPVEMFPYCDQLAKQMNVFPSVFSVGSFITWLRFQLAPATTLHYHFQSKNVKQDCRNAPIYMPLILITLLIILLPISWSYRAICWFTRLFQSKKSQELNMPLMEEGS